MKTMMLAAVAVMSLGIGSAYADGGDQLPDTQFTELPGEIATPSVQQAPSAMAANQDGAATHAYVTHQKTGTWLFPPDMNGGANS
jgi:hypothetical protein